MKTITIDFNADGTIEMEGKGFVGMECDKAMGHFEKALGSVKARKNKPEYSARHAQGATQKAGQ